MASSQLPNATTTGLAAVLAVSTAVVTLFADWITIEVQIPLGVLLVLFVLIILPTGDMLRLWSMMINNYTQQKASRNQFAPPDGPLGETSTDSVSPPPAQSDGESETASEHPNTGGSDESRGEP